MSHLVNLTSKSMPLSKSGKQMKAAMKKEYGKKKGESVFYATLNKKPALKRKMEGKRKK